MIERQSEPDTASLVTLRFSGDLGVKARATRSRFLRRLAHNLKDALAAEGVEARIERTRDRFLVEVPGPDCVSTVARVFGVQSASRVQRRPWTTLDDIVAAGVELYGERVRGKRFAVRARRVGDRSHISVSARDVDQALGAALEAASAGVDLGRPEITVSAEIFQEEVCFFDERVAGPGGLPLGVEGRALALVSGGFDSAVAAWMLLKRGVALDYVLCNLGGRSHLLSALPVLKVLSDRWSYGYRPCLHVIDFDPVSRALRSDTEMRYWQILLKRLMLRAAESVAREQRGAALVTGEAVGQVSSQTLQNLSVISRATYMTILRPLAGFNKEEIMGLARKIGTYELSSAVAEYCAMVSRKPATAAGLEAIEAEEARLDLDVLDQAVRERSVFDLRSLDTQAFERPELEVEKVPDDATLIDLRSKAAFAGWHHPKALWLDFPAALRAYPSFDPQKTYVLYCEFGLKSAHLAELMRRQGLRAFHVKNGLEPLKGDEAALRPAPRRESRGSPIRSS